MDDTYDENDPSQQYAEDVVEEPLAAENVEPEEGSFENKKRLVKPNYNPVDTLLTKLELWLMQQPEWAFLLQAPRHTRRQAIQLVAKRILTIPNRYKNV